MTKITNYPGRKKVNPTPIDSLNKIKKKDFTTFMLKEIFEQPKSISKVLAGRIILDKAQVKFAELGKIEKKLKQIKNIIIIACGSSWHAGLVGELLIEQLAKIPVEVEDASEFRYHNPIIGPDSLVIVISQSGETADILATLKLAQKKHAVIFSLCNVVGSTMTKLADASCYLQTGPEISVAASKSFTAELTMLTLLAIYLGRLNKKLKKQETQRILKELIKIPGLIKSLLDKNKEILLLAQKLKTATNFLYLGRGYNFPIALEGALKLKEISYIQAEGYPMGAIKHGPMALIDKKMTVVFIATQDKIDNKIIVDIAEVKACGAKIIALASKGDKKISEVADQIIYMPKTLDILMPTLNIIPLQLLAYYIAQLKGHNIDQPRNLTKVVKERK